MLPATAILPDVLTPRQKGEAGRADTISGSQTEFFNKHTWSTYMPSTVTGTGEIAEDKVQSTLNAYIVVGETGKSTTNQPANQRNDGRKHREKK